MTSHMTARMRAGRVAIAATLPLVAGTRTVAARAGSGGGEAGELLAVSGWTAVFALVVGSLVLLASIELLIHALVRTAVRYRVSAFLLAVVFSGIEFDNVAFGIFTGFRELRDVAFGLAIGNAISIFGLTLAVGVLVFPFEIDVPREYLGMMVASPFVLLPFLVTGQFTSLGGILLVGLFVAAFAYIVRRERTADRTFMRSREVTEAATAADGTGTGGGGGGVARLGALAHGDWVWPALLVVSLVGVMVGAEGSSIGVEGIIETWELSGTFLGVTLITVLLTLDDLLLIVEPLRLGHHEVAVGGVIGSLVFFVTANVGIVALVGTIHLSPSVLSFHFPVLVGMTLLSAYLLDRGRLTRASGALLLGAYLVYLLVNVVFLSGVPVGD